MFGALGEGFITTSTTIPFQRNQVFYTNYGVLNGSLFTRIASNNVGTSDQSYNYPTFGFRDTTGLTVRAFDPTKKTLVLITGGQSLASNILPTLYVPSANVTQFNIYDGNLYNVNGPVLGASYNPTFAPPFGPGNLCAMIADLALAHFDRVILACANMSSSYAALWATGTYVKRLPLIISGLSALGITAATPNVTMALMFDLGENDLLLGTSQAVMAANLLTIFANIKSAGFNGRIFVPIESGYLETSNPVRLAQASVWGGNIFSGGDWDQVAGRIGGGHFDDTGGANAAALTYSQMHASGLPF